MNKEIIEDVHDLLKYIKPNPEKIKQLLTTMEYRKKVINTSLGLKEKNNYRLIIDTTLTDDEFKDEYPYCFKLVSYLVKDKEFSIIDNWIVVDKNKMKLSKYLNKFNWKSEVPNTLYKGMINELGRNDSTALFDVAKSKSLVISTNMYDFLTSATNTSYRSCYTIDGSHFNGNIAYCQDNFTAIVYTYSKDIKRKIGRIYIYVFPETKTFVISRVYGSFYGAEIKKATKEIQNRLDANGKWNVTFFEYYSDVYSNARPFYSGPLPVFFDAQYTRIFHTKDKLHEADVPFLDFRYSYCLKCGKTTKNGHYGICGKCQEYVVKCNHCTNPVHDSYIVNGRRVCPDCIKEYYKECPHCGELRHKDQLYKTPDTGELWCNNCIDKEYSYCMICNDIHRKDKDHCIGPSSLCPKCWGKYVIPCSECGIPIIDKKDYRMTYILDNKRFCKHCYSQQDGSKVFIAGRFRDIYKRDNKYNIGEHYQVETNIGDIQNITSNAGDEITLTAFDMETELHEFNNRTSF